MEKSLLLEKSKAEESPAVKKKKEKIGEKNGPKEERKSAILSRKEK